MKRIFKTLCIFTFVLFGVVAINGCKKDNDEEVAKEVPAYEGMLVKRKETQLLKNDYKNKDRKKDKLKGDIEGILSEDVVDDDEIKYYVSAKETFVIHIKLKNPSNFEIQSFTLNGKKYASYMFNEGSDMENLYLDVEAPEASGYSEYTIDAIKYIDGTKIKDVDLKGDTSVKVGILYEEAPSVNITNKVINETSFSIKVNLKDEHNVIGNNDKKIVLSDGEKIIDSKSLEVGVNNITFNNLEIDRKYQYAVIAVYDMCDGNGLKSNILFKEEVQTEKAFGMYATNISDNSITFNVSKYYALSDIVSISLYDGDDEYNFVDELTNISNVTNVFDELLSDHNYVIEIVYRYNTSGTNYIEDTQVLEFKTLKKIVPSVDVKNIVSSKTSLNFELDIEDESGILNIDSISLIDKDDNLILNITNFENLTFEGLTLNTLYKIKIAYHYNLNNGEEVVYDDKIVNCSTSANEITVTELVILNNTTPKVGEYVHVRVSFENPSDILLDSIYVNGIESTVDGGDLKSSAIIKFIPEFNGGVYEVVLSEVKYTTNGVEIKQKMSDDFSEEVFILGDVEVLSIEGNKDEDYIINEENNLIINLRNETGYEIIEVTINNSTFTKDEIVIINNNKISVSYPISSNSEDKYIVKSIKYGMEGVEPITKAVGNIECHLIGLYDEEIQIINNAEELQNMNSGYIYKLGADIDLSNYNWQSYNFSGILLGDNHKISNYTVVVESPSLDEQRYGLFISFSGIVKDLTMDNVYMSVKNYGRLYIGAFASYISSGDYYSSYGYTLFDNLNIKGSINVSLLRESENSSADSYIGGLSARTSSTVEIINSNFDVDISINDGRREDRTYAGGVISYVSANAYNMDNVEVEGDLTYNVNVEEPVSYSDSRYIGGVAGYISLNSNSDSYKYLTNVRSSGKIKVTVIKSPRVNTFYVGGMFGNAVLSKFNIVDNLISNTQIEFIAKNVVSAGSTRFFAVGGIFGALGLPEYISNLKFTGNVIGTIENVNAEKNIVVGGVAGSLSVSSGTNENVIYKAISTGTVGINHSIEVNKKYLYAGGLFGYNSSGSNANLHIKDSYVSGDVIVHSESPEICKVNSEEYAGGFIAYNNSNLVITNSYVSGKVVADSLVSITGAGGFVADGYSSSTTIEIYNSYVTGAVFSSHRSGGLIGETSSTTIIEDSYVSGNVSASSPWGTSAGGLIANANGYSNSGVTIKNSYVSGKVSTGFRAVDDYEVHHSSVGGLIAEISSYNIIVENSYFIGESISAYGLDVHVGGIIGKTSSFSTTSLHNIKNSYVVTDIIAESVGIMFIGGIAGEYYGGISDTYFRGNMTIKAESAWVGDIYGRQHNSGFDDIEDEYIEIINCYTDNSNQINMDTIDSEGNRYKEVSTAYSKERIWQEISSTWDSDVWDLFTYKDPLLK